MGALRGSLSVSKLYVKGEIPRDFRRSFMQRMRLRIFTPLSPDEDVEERMGWCAVGKANDLELAPGKVFYNDYLNLGFRQDRWRFPQSVIQAQLQEALKAELTKSGTEKLSKNQKAALKLQVIARLKRRYFPTVRQTDVSWNMKRGVVHFWSHSTSVQEHFRALFELTFGLELIVNSPYVAAKRAAPQLCTEESLHPLTLTLFQSKARDGHS